MNTPKRVGGTGNTLGSVISPPSSPGKAAMSATAPIFMVDSSIPTATQLLMSQTDGHNTNTSPSPTTARSPSHSHLPHTKDYTKEKNSVKTWDGNKASITVKGIETNVAMNMNKSRLSLSHKDKTNFNLKNYHDLDQFQFQNQQQRYECRSVGV